MVTLREIGEADEDALFAMKRDPESVVMAAFTAADPDDRAAYDAHRERIRADPRIIERAILADGRLVGSIASFVIEGDRELTYWIDRAYWGRGIAGQALAAFLPLEPTRPLHARAASDNIGSLKVLQRAGFTIVGTDSGYAAARGAEIEETLLILS